MRGLPGSGKSHVAKLIRVIIYFIVPFTFILMFIILSPPPPNNLKVCLLGLLCPVIEFDKSSGWMIKLPQMSKLDAIIKLAHKYE